MSGLVQFARSIRPRLAQLKQATKAANALIITGNESADLDSCTCSVLTAYFYSRLTLPAGVDSVLPLIDIPRGDFKTRPDVEFLFKELGITKEHLVFQEDLKELIQNSNVKLHAFLVDHNRLVGSHPNIFENVMGVIDHHDDEGLYKDCTPRVVQKSGSCASLVINHFKGFFGSGSPLHEKEVARLAMGPILIDTSNMSYKVEQVDVEALDVLKSGIDLDPQTLFSTLDSRKKDLDMLSLNGIFKKDYKQWDGKLQLGVSSVPKPLSYLLTKDDFIGSIKHFVQEKRLDVFVIMTSFENEEQFCRELGIYIANDPQDSIQKFLDNSSTLGLEPKNIEGVRAFDQKNVKCSRKQVAPLLRESLHDISLQNL